MKTEEKGISTAAIVGIVVTVVVVAVVGCVAAVILLQPGGGGGGGLTTTTTTTQGGTTSLTCTVDYTSENMSGTVTLKAKNMGTNEFKIREEGTIQINGVAHDVIEIVNGELRRAWTCTDGQWMDVSASFSMLAESYENVSGQFSGWTGGDITYTEPTTGYAYRIYDIVLNPVLDDSLFIGQGGETTTTPVTTTTTTPSGGVTGATSLDFKEEVTTGGQTTTMRFRARNIGTTNLDIRVDATMSGMTISYILSGSQQQGWMNTGTGWTSFSDLGMDFSSQWSTYSSSLGTSMSDLSGWVSGEWSGTYGGVTYRIYDIQVNPLLPDSVFQPS